MSPISDTMREMASDDFSRFFRARNTGGIKHIGIGPHTVNYFRKLHAGSVRLRSRENERTEIALRFPAPWPATHQRR